MRRLAKVATPAVTIYVIDIPETWFAKRGILWQARYGDIFAWIAQLTGRHVNAAFVRTVLVGKGVRTLHRDKLFDRQIVRYAFTA